MAPLGVGAAGAAAAGAAAPVAGGVKQAKLLAAAHAASSASRKRRVATVSSGLGFMSSPLPLVVDGSRRGLGCRSRRGPVRGALAVQAQVIDPEIEVRVLGNVEPKRV